MDLLQNPSSRKDVASEEEAVKKVLEDGSPQLTPGNPGTPLNSAPRSSAPPASQELERVARACEDGSQELIVLLEDILPMAPTRCLKAGFHNPVMPLRFHMDELCEGIIHGRVTVPLSRLAELCPSVFIAPAPSSEDPSIRLPLQKLIEQVGLAERPRQPILPAARQAEAAIEASEALQTDGGEALLQLPPAEAPPPPNQQDPLDLSMEETDVRAFAELRGEVLNIPHSDAQLDDPPSVESTPGSDGTSPNLPQAEEARVPMPEPEAVRPGVEPPAEPDSESLPAEGNLPESPQAAAEEPNADAVSPPAAVAEAASVPAPLEDQTASLPASHSKEVPAGASSTQVAPSPPPALRVVESSPVQRRGEAVQLAAIRPPAPRPPVFAAAPNPPKPVVLPSPPARSPDASLGNGSLQEGKIASAEKSIPAAAFVRPTVQPPRLFAGAAPDIVSPTEAPPTEPKGPPLREPSIPPLALPRFNQTALQGIFLTDDRLDLSRVAALCARLPAVSGCLIVAGDEFAQAGRWPEQVTGEAVREISRRFEQDAASLVQGAFGYTMHAEPTAYTLLVRGSVCLGIAHAPQGFPPGGREKLIAIASALAAETAK